MTKTIRIPLKWKSTTPYDRTGLCRTEIRALSLPYPSNVTRKAELQHFAKNLTTELTANEIVAPLTKEQRRQLDRNIHYVCRFKNGLKPNVFSPQEIATMDHILHILDIHFDEARDKIAPRLKRHFFGVTYLLPKIIKQLNREDVLFQIPTIAPTVEIAKNRATQELIWNKIEELANLNTKPIVQGHL